MKKMCLGILSIVFLLIGCSITPVETVPYMISGDFEMETDSEDYSVCGIDLLLLNQSAKDINEFSIVFYLFDKDGEPAKECSNRISFDIEKTIDAGDSFKQCLSLDKYMYMLPEDLLFVDYLYVSRIVYSDGSVWEDPYGLFVFR